MTLVGFAQSGSPCRRFANLSNEMVSIYCINECVNDELVAVGDLSENDHVVFQASSRLFMSFRPAVRCRVSLLLIEPRVIQGRFYSLMPLLAPRFHRVFSHYPQLVASLPNGRLIHHGGSWLQHSVDAASKRSSLLSLVASAKKSTAGQKLRHRIADWGGLIGNDMSLLGYGYQPFFDREEGFLPYRYSVVIENCRDPGYFTEKLIDCLLCGTVPIYWGDPDIGRHFDMKGIIACSNEDEIKLAVSSISNDDYNSRRVPILRNAQAALKYVNRRFDVAAILRAEA